MSRINQIGTITKITRQSEEVYKRGQGGEIVTDSQGNPVVAFTAFTAMVILKDTNGNHWQWFGKKQTAFWQDNFSSKIEDPLKEGDAVQFECFPKIVNGEHKVYFAELREFTDSNGVKQEWDAPERTVVQRPKILAKL